MKPRGGEQSLTSPFFSSSASVIHTDWITELLTSIEPWYHLKKSGCERGGLPIRPTLGRGEAKSGTVTAVLDVCERI